MLSEDWSPLNAYLYKMVRIIFRFVVGITLVSAGLLYWGYRQTFGPNVRLDAYEVFISDTTSFDVLMSQFERDEVLENPASFKRLARIKKYPSRMRAGHYVLVQGMDNNTLINRLASGGQTPVRITLNQISNFKEMAGVLSRQVMADSASIYRVFTDPENRMHYGFSEETYPAMFIPNTYEVYWTLSPRDLLARFAREFKAYWNEDRKRLARELGLSQSQVATLASIVERETVKADEMPVVAGLYVNRLKKPMPLQADPTVIFALHQQFPDSVITRVLKRDLQIDSPYNTYRVPGLPPGPIGFPSIRALESVLQHAEHPYLFMCADIQRPGYHAFATSYRAHQRNQAKYTQWLDSKRIYR